MFRCATSSPRIAQQIALAFAVDIDKDVVRRVLAAHYRPDPGVSGPSWLTFLGHAKDSLWSIDLRSGPRNLDSGLSGISIVFQAAVPKPVVPKYTTSGVRRPSEL